MNLTHTRGGIRRAPIVIATATVVAAAAAYAITARTGAAFTHTEEAPVAVESGVVEISLSESEGTTVEYDLGDTKIGPGWEDTFEVTVTNDSTVNDPANSDIRVYVTEAPTDPLAGVLMAQFTDPANDGEELTWDAIASTYDDALLPGWISPNAESANRTYTVRLWLPEETDALPDADIVEASSTFTVTFEARNTTE